MSESTYRWSGFTLPDGQDPLGVWGFALEPSEGAAAYAADAFAEGMVWQVRHPSTSREVRRVLQGQLRTIDRRLRELDNVAHHLSGLSPTPAFGTAVASPYDNELLAEVTTLAGSMTAFSRESPQVTSYGPLLAQARRIEATSTLLAQLRQLVQHWARVETRIRERLVAVTTVDWTGDYETAWSTGLTPVEMALHLDDVKLALASRRALLRIISVVTTGALDLALKASVPGGQILLIPAVYKYVRDVLAELEHLPEGALTG